MGAMKYTRKLKGRTRVLLRAVALIFVLLFTLSAFASCDNGTKDALAEALLEIEALKAENADASREIESLKKENAEAADEIEGLKNTGEELSSEIDALKTERDALKTDCTEAEKAIESLETEIETLEKERDEQKAEIERLEGEIKNIQDSMTEKIRIYVDQGHNPTGSHNSGAIGNGLYEQDLTFLVGQLLAERLRNDPRFEVCLSRPTADTVLGTDNTSSLEARVHGAREFNADLFISLHTNAAESTAACGIEALVAYEGGISYAFGSALLESLVTSTGLTDRGMKLRPELHVLKNATMPAVLLEMGFISNEGDSALLAGRPELFADGIYAGILNYFGLSPYSV